MPYGANYYQSSMDTLKILILGGSQAAKVFAEKLPQILKQLRKQAPIEWKKKYGDDLKWLITFVAGGNNGAVYKADNWKQIGETAGLPKHKAVSMKWHKGKLDKMFVKPTGENKKIIFIKKLDLHR